jgi:alanine dehydrogenase
VRVGTVREIKPGEGRVAVTPGGVRALLEDGHAVFVEAGAGARAGFSDRAYIEAGARVTNAESIWSESELLLKVKEPIPSEFGRICPDQILFTFLHLAANPQLVDALLSSGATAVAYETVRDSTGGLPLLAPMSEIAGRLATQAGAYFLQDPLGGRGVLIGGAAGVAPARVLVLGGGVVGMHAARVAVGMGANVTILEVSPSRLTALEGQFETRARVLMSDPSALCDELATADLIIGAVLRPGERTPSLISRQSLGLMRDRAVLADVAIDQGGCAETSRPTSHEDPIFAVDGVLHYCVANMPGAVPITSTRALTNATLPYIRKIAALGIDEAVASEPGLADGINVRDHKITHPAVSQAYAAATVTA